MLLVARDEARLAALAAELSKAHGTSARVMPADLARPGAAEELFRRVEAGQLTVDVLVNNAGFGTYGPFAGTDPAKELAMLQLNIVALTMLTRLFLPGMLARKSGGILNVASTAAFQPGPLMSVYYASKAFVVSFSEALSNEVAGSGVQVTALCPGPTRTEFQARAGIGETRMMSGRIMDARTAALAGCRGLAEGRALVIPGFRNKLLATVARWMPRSVVLRAVRHIQEHRSA